MALVDSHCHLDLMDLKPFGGSVQAVVDEAQRNGVRRMLCVSVGLGKLPKMLGIVERFEGVLASVGSHPNQREPEEPDVARLVQLSRHPRVVAIGETGLDYYRSEGDLEWQRERFRTHIAAAKQTAKPLIIHSREAKADTLRILRQESAEEVGGVMHCFTEDWPVAAAAMDLNFYISFSGIVTFRSAEQLQEVARRMPLERMLIETDSPYLAPIPHRGRQNQPAYVRHVAEFIAELRGTSFEEIAEVTTYNFAALFRC
jgi:TatD DNase family protein